MRRLYENGIRGFHLCTLNLEKSVTRVLEALDWVDPAEKRERRVNQRVSTRQSPLCHQVTCTEPLHCPRMTDSCAERRSSAQSCQLAPPSTGSGCQCRWTRDCAQRQSCELGRVPERPVRRCEESGVRRDGRLRRQPEAPCECSCSASDLLQSAHSSLAPSPSPPRLSGSGANRPSWPTSRASFRPTSGASCRRTRGPKSRSEPKPT